MLDSWQLSWPVLALAERTNLLLQRNDGPVPKNDFDVGAVVAVVVVEPALHDWIDSEPPRETRC